MRHFFLIRHGETDWNRLDLMQGQSDIELNALGEAQARAIAPFIQSLHIEAVVTSDLKRAQRTAELALPHLPRNLDPRLREVHLGQGEGLKRSDLVGKFGEELITTWTSAGPEGLASRLPDGESRLEALARLDLCLEDWSQRLHGKRVAFVAHGMLMRLFAQRCLGFYKDGLRAPNCAIFEFSRKGTKFCLRQIYHPCE